MTQCPDVHIGALFLGDMMKNILAINETAATGQPDGAVFLTKCADRGSIQKMRAVHRQGMELRAYNGGERRVAAEREHDRSAIRHCGDPGCTGQFYADRPGTERRTAAADAGTLIFFRLILSVNSRQILQHSVQKSMLNFVLTKQENTPLCLL